MNIRIEDGPVSPLFRPLQLKGEQPLPEMADAALPDGMAAVREKALAGENVTWGFPFDIGGVISISDETVRVDVEPTSAQWLVFMHTSDLQPHTYNESRFITPMRGEGHMAEHAADYVIGYEDGSEVRTPVRHRHQIGGFQRRWGENCVEAVAVPKPYPLRASHEQLREGWGRTQTRVEIPDQSEWVNWLWAWQNPHPRKAITSIRFEPVSGHVVISAVAAGDAGEQPLRWRARRKAVLRLPEDVVLHPDLDDSGLLQQIQLDMGQVISATPRLIYPKESWSDSYANALPQKSGDDVLIEYTAHPDAHFHLVGGQIIPVSSVESEQVTSPLQVTPTARQRVKIRTVAKESGKRVATKLHIHGAHGEYLAPIDRHRIINPAWFEDYSVDYAHIAWWDPETLGAHSSTYISGDTTIDVPLGTLYIEVTKGFEMRPVRQVVEVAAETEEIVIELDKVLTWRERGWVTADTHVHFLSPTSALLEGAAEGVNVINLLASQWGELMTNVGDFDGRTTWGSQEAGGEGEYLVRVGTENRQHVLGHISLLGYNGSMITPLTTGGANESALGDAVDVLLTEWARACRAQGGLVVIPHFPDPRLENAATLVCGDADAIEMTSWGNHYEGIDPYSLSDWYRYLNCGYQVAAVGGTDKMSASMAVGTIRTYAHTDPNAPFTHDAWMNAVRRVETFVTYGPLLEFSVDGQAMGSRFAMSASGGTVDVVWEVASVTLPISRVELIVNGEIRESVAVESNQKTGHWKVSVDRSSWMALLVRGHYPDKAEIIGAHSSAIMIDVEGSPMLAAADAVTILEQIEGSLAYIDTVGTRAQDVVYKRMRQVLVSAHRSLHNRMHEQGHYHEHTQLADHDAHF